MAYDKDLKKTLERYPASTLQDIMKFFYQSLLGPGHLITSYEEAYNSLKDECEHLMFYSNMINEPLTEEMSNNTLRVNLRPYVYKKYDLGMLAKAFYESQNKYSGDQAKLVNDLIKSRSIIEALFPRFDEEEFNSYIAAIKEYGCKPFSHSLTYKTNYHPHYRIVNKELFLKLLDNMERKDK